MTAASIGVNLIGYASADIGLGVVLRDTALALITNGHSVAVLDIDAGGGRSRVNLTLQRHFVPDLQSLPHELNIWVCGAASLPRFALEVCDNPILQSRFNVAFVWWELSNIPALWSVAAQAFDALLTGSEFVRETFANRVPNTPVLMARHPLKLPAGVQADRARFGLPTDALLFVAGFDPGSDPVRKNPFASILAFQRAFTNDSAVRLVIKVNDADNRGHGRLEMDRLRNMVAGDSRIRLLTEQLSYRDVLNLYATCDVAVSLHRSEGLGLMPLEAMRLGKPVVATAWSGNMTYMSHTNAALVQYDLVAVDETTLHYQPAALDIRARWAEPNIQHAAQWMRALANDAGLRRALGERARLDSQRYVERAELTEFVGELTALRQHREWLPAKDFKGIRQQVQRLRNRQQGLPSRIRQQTKAYYRRLSALTPFGT